VIVIAGESSLSIGLQVLETGYFVHTMTYNAATDPLAHVSDSHVTHMADNAANTLGHGEESSGSDHDGSLAQVHLPLSSVKTYPCASDGLFPQAHRERRANAYQKDSSILLQRWLEGPVFTGPTSGMDASHSDDSTVVLRLEAIVERDAIEIDPLRHSCEVRVKPQDLATLFLYKSDCTPTSPTRPLQTPERYWL
jgi:hypothetical protein